MIATQEDNWTLAVLVPDQMGKREAMQCGFPKDNIAIWDATSTQGLEEAGQVIQQATENFMMGRAQGIRGSRAVFSTGADAVNKDTVKAAGLTPVDASEYQLIPVARDAVIRDWVIECGHTYRTGCAFYQLSKSEKIQARKQIAVLEKKTDRCTRGRRPERCWACPTRKSVSSRTTTTTSRSLCRAPASTESWYRTHGYC